MKWEKGSNLSPEIQQECLRAYVNRHTRDHIPKWAEIGVFPIQFDSDRDWLENTKFAVKKDGTLDDRVSHCESTPTWPEEPLQ